MGSLLRRTASVLLTTAIVALGVYSAVQFSSRAFADRTEVASATTSAGTQAAAQDGTSTTGTTATTIQNAHSTTTALTGTASQSQTGSATLVCPRTGCTASSCHATDPSAPGGRR